MRKKFRILFLMLCLLLPCGAAEERSAVSYALPCIKLHETPAPQTVIQENGVIRVGRVGNIMCMDLIRGSLRFQLTKPENFSDLFSISVSVLPDEYDEPIPLIRIYKKLLLKSNAAPIAVSLTLDNGQLQFAAGTQKCSVALPEQDGWMRLTVELHNGEYTIYCNGKSLQTLKCRSRSGIWHEVELGANLRRVYAEELLLRDFELKNALAEKETATAKQEKEAAFIETGSFSTMFKEQEKKYRRMGLKVETGSFNRNDISGRKIDQERLRARAEILYTALDVLPPKFIKKSGIKTVYIVDALTLKQYPAGGIASGDTMYLNAYADAGTIYHELYHIFDKERETKRWSSANHDDFKYRGSSFTRNHRLTRQQRREIRSNRKNKTYDLDFVSQYAMSFEWEDRAETFAYMMREGSRFKRRIERSDAIRKKALYIVRTTGTGRLLGTDFWPKHLDLDVKELKKPVKSNKPR